MLRLRLFPQGEIVWCVLVALSVKTAGPFLGILKVASGKHSVMIVFVVFFYVKINASIALVCISGIENALHGLYLLEDVSRSSRLYGRRSHIQLPHGLMIPKSVGLHDLHRLQLLKPGLFGYFVLPLISIVLQVPHICNIAHIAHLVSKMTQKLAENIVCYTGTGMSKMRIPIYGRTADIHPHMAGVNRYKKLFSAG